MRLPNFSDLHTLHLPNADVYQYFQSFVYLTRLEVSYRVWGIGRLDKKTWRRKTEWLMEAEEVQDGGLRVMLCSGGHVIELKQC